MLDKRSRGYGKVLEQMAGERAPTVTMDKGQADAKVNGFRTRTLSSRTTVCGTMKSSKPFIFGGMGNPLPLPRYYS